MAKANVGGNTLEYVEQGQGTPVVFVHGGISDWRTWENQLKSFSHRHRAISYSRRYFWPNAPAREGEAATTSDHAADLSAFLRTIRATPAHVVGNSEGAYISLLLAVREPALVRSLVLTEPPLIPLVLDGPPGPEALQRLAQRDPPMAKALGEMFQYMMGPAQEAFSRGSLDEGLSIFAPWALGGPRFYEALPATRKEQMRQNVGPLASSLLNERNFAPFTESDARSVKTPTLLVYGEHSPVVLRLLSERLESLIPGARRVDIKGVSHVPHEQDPAAFDAAVLAFLEKHDN